MTVFLRRAAHLGQRGARYRRRETGAENGLARRRLPHTGHQAAAHQRFVDILDLDARLRDGGLDRHGAEFRRTD